MKEFSYSKNTLFLIVAGIFSQIIGAILRILLSYRLKETGMALYQVAFSVYAVFLTPVLCGLPIAVTRFISKRLGTKSEGEIPCGISFAFYAEAFLGVFCGFLMLISRRFFATALKEPDANLAILALCPSVFFVALGAFAKSCFEGRSNMLPLSVASVAESMLKLLFASILTAFFGIFSVKYAAFGATFAITLGEAFATLILFLFMVSTLKKLDFRSFCGIAPREIISYALPVAIYALLLSSVNLLEHSVIRNSLLSLRFSDISAQRFAMRYAKFTSVFDTVTMSKRLTPKGADWLYGAYFGYALTVIRFASGLFHTFCVPFFPVAAKCLSVGDIKRLQNMLIRLFRAMLFLSLPLYAVFMGFAPQITTLIFGSKAYALMLFCAAPILVLSPITELFTTLWYAHG
ncbi:MAG: oligosaccharide flippase family protein, partial [Clostridia bacterium]|nr:oligosaccharide flippase family protein [Clostridia bacterium]